jgi:cytochrome c oxidase assembly protein subunit 11
MSANPVSKTLVKLLLGVVGMFVFALFVMPPLYNVFCDITGIGGKTGGPYQVTESGVDVSRSVKVQFVATNNGAMPWEFAPKTYEITVHPGEATKVEFYAKNRTSRDMVAQAIPNVTPFSAAEYFHKTECFCFNQQPLEAGTEADLPLVFIVDRDLPKAINTITLSYTLFDVTDRTKGSLAQVN